MARKWLYFAFDDISQDPTMPGNCKRYEEKYGADLTVVMKGESLSLVESDDMLIIAGHGLPHTSDIAITTGPATKKSHKILGIPAQTTMTANDLADQLKKSGLPIKHKYIKLLTCGGAGMVAVDDENAKIDNGKVTAITVSKHIHEHECLASVLAASLGKRDYNDVRVKGYPGFVDATKQQKMVSVEGTSTHSQIRQMVELTEQTEEGEKKSKVAMGRAQYGLFYWKEGTMGMVSIPSKFLNDFWFNSKGELQRSSLKIKI